MNIFEKRAKLRQEEAPMQAKNGIYTATDLLNMEIKNIPKLWDPFFPAKGLVGFLRFKSLIITCKHIRFKEFVEVSYFVR